MNLTEKNLSLAFVLSCSFTLLAPIVIPYAKLFFFSPFIIILFYQKSLSTTLWWALLCGLIVDLFNADTHLGLHAASYCVAAMLLYSQSRNFFSDTPSTLPIMSYLFSVVATVAYMGFIYIFEKKIVFTFGFVLTDLVYMPAFDALYAFCIYVLPFYCISRRPRKGQDYFLK